MTWWPRTKDIFLQLLFDNKTKNSIIEKWNLFYAKCNYCILFNLKTFFSIGCTVLAIPPFFLERNKIFFVEIGPISIFRHFFLPPSLLINIWSWLYCNQASFCASNCLQQYFFFRELKNVGLNFSDIFCLVHGDLKLVFWSSCKCHNTI